MQLVSTEATGNLFRSFSTVLPDAQVSGTNRPTFSLDPADADPGPGEHLRLLEVEEFGRRVAA